MKQNRTDRESITDDASAIDWFAERMKDKLALREKVLSDGSPSGRSQLGWRGRSYGWAIERMQMELYELDTARTPQERIDEAVDVANFALMAADIAAEELATKGRKS